MKINLKSTVKKSLIAFLGIASISSILALGSGAKASVTPPTGFSYAQPAASFYDRSTSHYYRSIWDSAAHAWNKTDAFRWHRSYNPNCRTFVSTVWRPRWNSIVGRTYWGYYMDNNGYQHGAHIYLNKSALNKFSYIKASRIEVAEHEMGHAIGLAHNNYNKRSVMYPYSYSYGPNYGIQTCDKEGVWNIYGGRYGLVSKALINKNLKGVLDIDYAKNYSGNQGLTSLKSQAPVIVEGTITNSKYHNGSAADDDNDYTNQTLNIDKSLKGNLKGTINFKQDGTNKVAVSDSTLLDKGQHVILMLNKDSEGHYYVINNGQGIFVKNHLVGATKGTNNTSFTRASDNSVHSLNEL